MHLDEELKSRDTLGDRMKDYEADALKHNMRADEYVVIRLDGNHFHTWVKKVKMKKPFDSRMISAMMAATLRLCEKIPTCIMGYTQSDEITLVLRKGETAESDPWFSNRVQKLCSISASICSVEFNDAVREQFGEEYVEPAYFDARVIFFPSLDEVINCLIWRQNDCIKNSVSALSHSLLPQKQLLNKNSDEQKKMMLELKGVDWNELPNYLKMGTLIHKEKVLVTYNGAEFKRGKFFCDEQIPRFSTDKQFLVDAYNFKLED